MTTARYSGSVLTAVRGNVRFALANALTSVARNAADAVRDEMRQDLRIRSATLARNFVRFGAAKRDRLVARVSVGAPNTAPDRDRGNILTQHDEAANTGSKAPRSGRTVAYPVGTLKAARPRRNDRGRGFGSLVDQLTDTGRAQGVVAAGKASGVNTVLFRRADGKLVMFKRTKAQRRREQRGTTLYVGVSRTRLPRRLGMVRQVRQVVQRELAGQVRVAMAAALANIRVRGLSTTSGVR